MLLLMDSVQGFKRFKGSRFNPLNPSSPPIYQPQCTRAPHHFQPFQHIRVVDAALVWAVDHLHQARHNTQMHGVLRLPFSDPPA